MPPGPAEPAAARSFATTASTRNGSSPTISAPSSSIALLRVPVSAPPKYVTPSPTTPSSVFISTVTIGLVAFGFSAASASGSSAGKATIEERIPDIFIASASAVEHAKSCTLLAAREARSNSRLLRRRAGRDVGAKAQRITDIADRLEAAAGAAHNDCAIAENATEQRLVDIDALDLVAVHLDRVPGEQA